MFGQKMIDPLVWQTRISPGMFLNSQHAHGQKMIDCPEWQTRNSPGIFFKESTCTWSKDDWSPQYDRPGSHLEFFLKIQHLYGQKIIDPPVWKTRISPGIFLKIQVHMVKRWLTPHYDRPGSHLEFFIESTCTWSKDDWSPQMTDQDVT